MENLLELLTRRKKEFESIRDKAEGAIQCIDIIFTDIRRAHEQQEKKEKENAEPEPAAESYGNGHATETA